jgi:murein DD-endopeptidase MepM/ murein hydrolase activator NlpD
MKKVVALIRSPLQFLRLITLLLYVTFFSAGSFSHADVFSYVDEEGVVSFTDCPMNKGAVRVYRERKGRGPDVSRSKSQPVARTGREISLDAYGEEMGLQPDLTLPVEGRISSTVGLRHDPIDGLLRFHNGIDIAIPEGTPVRPVAAGTVYFSGPRNGYGNMVIITHDDGLVTIYAHNSMNLMKEGERVGRETTIALSGSTGRSTGPHLHFEAWKNGSNMSEALMGEIPAGKTTLAQTHPRRDFIRSSIQADGSLLFTNLP